MPAKFNGDVEFSKRDNLTYELSMEGKGPDISGKGGATMNMELSKCEWIIHWKNMHYDCFYYGPRIAKFGSHMNEAVYNKLFEQFIQNVSNLLTQ